MKLINVDSTSRYRKSQLTKLREELFDIIVEEIIEKGNLRNKKDIHRYVIKNTHLLNGGERKVYCINYWSCRHEQIVQGSSYYVDDLKKILRKKKLEKINVRKNT